MFGIVLDEQNSQDFMDNLKRCVRFKATYSATMRGRKEALEKMSGDVVSASKKITANRRMIKEGKNYIVIEGKKRIYSSTSKSKALKILSRRLINKANKKEGTEQRTFKIVSRISELATSLEKTAHKVYSGFQSKRVTPYFQSLSIGSRKLFREQSGKIYANGKRGIVENSEEGVANALASLKKEISAIKNSKVTAAMLYDIAFLEKNISTKEFNNGWS